MSFNILVCILQGELWKVFLQVDLVDSEHYFSLVSKGHSSQQDLITRDINRTFTGNEKFHARVSKDQVPSSDIFNEYILTIDWYLSSFVCVGLSL